MAFAVLDLTGSVRDLGLVVGSALAQPASAAATPQTVPPELIQPANALIRLGMNAGTIGGAALGGLLVAAIGPGWGLALDALTIGFMILNAALGGGVNVLGPAVADETIGRSAWDSCWQRRPPGWWRAA